MSYVEGIAKPLQKYAVAYHLKGQSRGLDSHEIIFIFYSFMRLYLVDDSAVWTLMFGNAKAE